MSYNIDSWRTKSMVDFQIPLDIVQRLPCVEVELLPENKISASGVSEGFELKGELSGGNILVVDIHHSGASSGRTFGNLLEALKHSKGNLVATQVWEGGDSITKLIVKDGVVTEEQIEL